MQGVFISFEGIEGCGKSTQVRLLAEKLRNKGFHVLVTREPGDGEMGARIRELLLSVSSALDAKTELFLLAADRTRHVIEVIRPALEQGQIVICDRYADSSTAYQGSGRGLDIEFIDLVNQKATDGLWPVFTLVMDIAPEISVERSQIRLRQQNMFEAEGRFEQESLDFHTRVRNGYLALAEKEQDRIIVIDADEPIENLADTIWDSVMSKLDQLKVGKLDD